MPSDHFRAIRATGGRPALFVIAGYPIEDPNEPEFAPDFWPEDD